MCEVGRQAELTLQDLVDRLFPVLTGERRLKGEERKGLLKRLRLRFLFHGGAFNDIEAEILTDRSREHVVHQGAQTPPVHGSVVSASHQDLRGPATTSGRVSHY